MTETNTLNVQAPVDENARQQAEHKQQVINAARVLRGGFGDAKNYAQEIMIQQFGAQIFKKRVGTVDLGQSARTVDNVFTAAARDVAENAHDLAQEIAEQVEAHLKSIGICATKSVTLEHGIIALDMAKAAANWRPDRKLTRGTFFNAVSDADQK